MVASCKGRSKKDNTRPCNASAFQLTLLSHRVADHLFLSFQQAIVAHAFGLGTIKLTCSTIPSSEAAAVHRISRAGSSEQQRNELITLRSAFTWSRFAALTTRSINASSTLSSNPEAAVMIAFSASSLRAGTVLLS
jgi:hypothetical protein